MGFCPLAATFDIRVSWALKHKQTPARQLLLSCTVQFELLLLSLDCKAFFDAELLRLSVSAHDLRGARDEASDDDLRQTVDDLKWTVRGWRISCEIVLTTARVLILKIRERPLEVIHGLTKIILALPRPTVESEA